MSLVLNLDNLGLELGKKYKISYDITQDNFSGSDETNRAVLLAGNGLNEVTLTNTFGTNWLAICNGDNGIGGMSLSRHTDLTLDTANNTVTVSVTDNNNNWTYAPAENKNVMTVDFANCSAMPSLKFQNRVSGSYVYVDNIYIREVTDTNYVPDTTGTKKTTLLEQRFNSSTKDTWNKDGYWGVTGGVTIDDTGLLIADTQTLYLWLNKIGVTSQGLYEIEYTNSVDMNAAKEWYSFLTRFDNNVNKYRHVTNLYTDGAGNVGVKTHSGSEDYGKVIGSISDNGYDVVTRVYYDATNKKGYVTVTHGDQNYSFDLHPNVLSHANTNNRFMFEKVYGNHKLKSVSVKRIDSVSDRTVPDGEMYYNDFSNITANEWINDYSNSKPFQHWRNTTLNEYSDEITVKENQVLALDLDSLGVKAGGEYKLTATVRPNSYALGTNTDVFSIYGGNGALAETTVAQVFADSVESTSRSVKSLDGTIATLDSSVINANGDWNVEFVWNTETGKASTKISAMTTSGTTTEIITKSDIDIATLGEGATVGQLNFRAGASTLTIDDIQLVKLNDTITIGSVKFGDSDKAVNDKPIKITLKGDVDTSTVTAENIYLTGSGNETVACDFSYSNNVCTLTPKANLMVGSEYTIHVKNLVSLYRTAMSEECTQTFTAVVGDFAFNDLYVSQNGTDEITDIDSFKSLTGDVYVYLDYINASEDIPMTCYVAYYKDNSLVSLQVKNIDSEKFVIEKCTADYDSVSVMCWDNNMNPYIEKVGLSE